MIPLIGRVEFHEILEFSEAQIALLLKQTKVDA